MLSFLLIWLLVETDAFTGDFNSVRTHPLPMKMSVKDEDDDRRTFIKKATSASGSLVLNSMFPSVTKADNVLTSISSGTMGENKSALKLPPMGH